MWSRYNVFDLGLNIRERLLTTKGEVFFDPASRIDRNHKAVTRGLMLLQIASTNVPFGVSSDSIEIEEAGKTK